MLPSWALFWFSSEENHHSGVHHSAAPDDSGEPGVTSSAVLARLQPGDEKQAPARTGPVIKHTTVGEASFSPRRTTASGALGGVGMPSEGTKGNLGEKCGRVNITEEKEGEKK